MMNRLLDACGPMVVALLLFGCGNDATSGTDDGTMAPDGGGSQTTECASDKAAQPFSAGMSSKSADGTVSVAITSDPPTPTPDNYATWTLKVTDGSNSPMAGQAVTLAGLMQHSATYSHGLGQTPVVTETGGGSYAVKPIDFNMSGPWQIAVTVGSEQVHFDLCIE